MKYKLLLLGVGLLLLCAGCTKVSEKESDKLNVLMYNVELKEELAQNVAAEIKDVILASKEGVYTVDDFSFLYHTDPQSVWLNDGNMKQMEIHVSADYEMSRKPEESPLIQGMYDAQKELSTKEEQEHAQKIIDGHIAILREEGKKQRLEYVLECVFDEAGEFEISYTYIDENGGVWVPIEEYFVKEDAEALRKSGYELFWLDYRQ